MKRRLINIISLGAIALGSAFAQGPRPFDHGTPPDPATMIARQVERLTALLTLTTAQQQQATTIFTNAATATTPIRTNLQTARTSLTAAIKANQTASIDNLAAQIGSLEGQETGIQSKAQAAFYAILTAEQKTKYDSRRGPGGPGGGFGSARFRGPENR